MRGGFRKICLLFSVLCLLFSTAPALARDWKEEKSDHFLAYFTGDVEFAKEVLNKAEKYYKTIAMDLGYPRYSDFWLWNDRVKIYIYPDHKLYLKATGEPDWSHGFADYKKKQITSYDRGEDFINSFLPHEIAHLVFRDFIGFKGEAPLWLDEGVAQWAELPKRMEFKSLIKKAYDENSLLMLEYIMDLNIRRLKEKKVYIRRTITKKGEPSVLFLSKKGILDTYYLQAFSLIGFLIEEHGADKFSHFCRQLRDGKSLKQALSFAYSTVYIRNIEELETKWREYLAGS